MEKIVQTADKQADLIDLYIKKKGLNIVDVYGGQPGDILVIVRSSGDRWLKPGPHKIVRNKTCNGPGSCTACYDCPTPGHYYVVEMNEDLQEDSGPGRYTCVTCQCHYYIYKGTNQ